METIVSEMDKHLQINEFLFETMEEYRAAYQHIRESYAGFEIDFCYHRREPPAGFMAQIGAELLESCVELRLKKEDFNPVAAFETKAVTAEGFDAFAALHNRINPGIYWTAERIGADLSRWCIRVHGQIYVLMSLWSSTAEIYALVADNAGQKATLLSAAAKEAFAYGKTGVLFMADEDAYTELDAARRIGFAVHGSYIAYRGKV